MGASDRPYAPDIISQWPQNVTMEKAILQDESLDGFYDKLLNIYSSGALNGFVFRLGAKALTKSYDQVMGGFERWHFYFMEGNIQSSVDLYFKNDKLERIHHEYAEVARYYN